jgi:peptidyl-dipeptidase Dcp
VCLHLRRTDAAPATAVVSNNVLLKEWTGPYGGVPPWDQVKPELFPEAFQVGIDQLLAETDAIANNTAYPSFENTIEAMEKSGRTLDRVQALFGVMTDNMSTPAYQALDKEWSPKLSAAYDKINLNSKLFARIATVYEHRDHVGLDAKQMRLLTRTYEGFVRRGAKLNDAQKAQLSGYNQQLATDFSEFNSRLLADEATFTQASEADMAGVQQDVKDAAAGVAKAKGLPAGTFAIRNTRSAVEPVLSFGTNRALREKVWRAFVNRGDNGDANDTNAIIAKIVKLRADRAKLLGYANHAEWRMQDTMAKSPDRAMDLMMRVWKPAVARVHEEVADMKPFAAKDGVTTIEPWDYRYYQEKVRKAKYDLSEDEIKPYFEQGNLLKGMHWAAEQLYDLHFEENTGKVPGFNPDVRTFEVTNKKTGEVVGLWYLDTFAREGKRSGAWMNTYRARARLTGDTIVLASNNNNFTKPEAWQADPAQPVRCRDDVPRVRPCDPLPAGRCEISVAWRIAARFRRISKPGERELAADAADPRKIRPPLPDRRTNAGGAGRQDQEGGHVQPGLRHGRISVLGAGRHEAAPRSQWRDRSGRVREEGPGRNRHAEGNGDAASPAAVRAPLLVGQLFGRLL